MAELQEDLADSQADKSIEAQKEALDQMEKDYHEEKDQEIKILEDSPLCSYRRYQFRLYQNCQGRYLDWTSVRQELRFASTNDALHQKAVNLARQLDQYGIHADLVVCDVVDCAPFSVRQSTSNSRSWAKARSVFNLRDVRVRHWKQKP